MMMTTWSMISFPDSNSPIMEQLISFHDHTMIIVVMITMMISYMLINIFLNKFYNRNLTENQNIEIIWTILPTFLLLFIAMPSLRLLYLMEENFEPSLTIKVIGHQWYWSYELTNFNIQFDSFMIPENELNKADFRLLETDNRIIIPYNTNIRFLITSADVIHSWTIPALGIKMDAIPGRLNQSSTLANRPGLFYGQCSEICGANHTFMPISMEITNLKNFMSWIKKF
uniref:Cytochrome c oxidase subunit 2 n=1 Tax=Macrocheles muscaedomesticae TaxID=406086 RepID=A0A6B9WGY0_9ACAR|nr:cytochrome c oxidase subunit II [Macrocheles muscaedomesticae]QHQ98524.1 cytochrome oxidase subunit 2 [Macrocheles muscaedomesticae]